MNETIQKQKIKTTEAKDRRRWKGIHIQPRDVRLLRYLLVQKFLTLEQIHRSCYEGLSLQMPRLRLRKLEHFGLIKPQRVYTESRQVYLLDRAGYHRLENMGLDLELGFMERIDLRVFEHDKAVTDMRLVLEKAGIGSWKSERELRRERPGVRVSDALFRQNGKSVALEYENADKGITRYQTIFLDHLEQPAADHILYVVPSPEKRKSLLQILGSLTKKRLGLDLGRISFSLADEVMTHALKAPALNLKRGEILIGGI